MVMKFWRIITLTIQSRLPHAGTWALPLRALVSNVANSKFQTGPDFPREQLHLSIRAFDKDLPAKPDALVGPRLHAERENAVAAKKRGGHARKHSGLFQRPNSS